MSPRQIALITRRLFVFITSVLIVICVTAILVYYYYHHHQQQQQQQQHRIDRLLQATNNSTYRAQYDLGDDVKITVCYPNNTTVVDIRQFLEDRATIKGIQLNIQQWNALMTYAALVDYIVRYGGA